MLELCLAGIGGLIGYYRYINRDSIILKKFINQFKSQWKLCMSYANIKNHNDETYELLNIIPKQYGYDCIISIPFGLSAKKLYDNINMLENNFSCNISLNLSSKQNTLYARFILYSNNLNELDLIRYTWNKIMFSNIKLYNDNLQTFNILKIKKQDKYGYDLLISIPLGQSISSIEAIKAIIETNFKCKLYIDTPQDNKCLIKLITKDFSDDYKFIPIKCSPTQLYLGMTYDYKPVIIDLKDLAHMLYTGMNGSGKTVCLLTALTNLIYWHNDNSWDLYMSMISTKKDLRIFKDIKQCKYYAETLDQSYQLLKYLYFEMNKRNKLFNSDKENCIVNIYEWNEKHPNKKLKSIIFACDELSFYMPDEFDSKPDSILKTKCINLLVRLLKEARSTGIHILGSLQRPDKENLSPVIKAQFGIKVCFYQPNIASSLVVIDSDEATKLKKTREAIVDADERYLMKTLYITPDMIMSYIKKSIEPNHQYINLNINPEKSIQNTNNKVLKKKTIKNQEKKQKSQEIIENLIDFDKNKQKIYGNFNRNSGIVHSMPMFKANNKANKQKAK